MKYLLCIFKTYSDLHYLVPLITTSPMDMSVPINTEAVFTCYVSVRNITEVLNVSWNGPVGDLPMPTMQPDPTTDTLYISILTVNITDSSLEGSYNCTAGYSTCSSSLTSNSATLSILPPPTILQAPMDVGVVIVGDTVSFNCSSTSEGNVSISWTGPRPNLLSISESSNMGMTSTLTFAIHDVSNGGEYACIASNEAGSDMETIVLYIRPELSTIPTDLLTSVGAVFTLMCLMQNQPPSTIQWEKINDNGMFDILVNETRVNLTINPVMFGDEGTYRCVVNFPQLGKLMSPSDMISGMLRC